MYAEYPLICEMKINHAAEQDVDAESKEVEVQKLPILPAAVLAKTLLMTSGK